MSVATLLLPLAGGTLQFAIARSNAGWPIDQISNMVEPLQSPGVDGERIRVRRRIYQPWTMTTYQDYATYTAAVNDGRIYELAKGQPCQLIWAASDFAQTWLQVLVEDMTVRISSGILNGAGTLGSSGTTVLTAQWRMVCQASPGNTP